MIHRARARRIAVFLVAAGSIGCSHRPASETHSPPRTGSIPFSLPPCNEPDQSPLAEEYLPAGQMGPRDKVSDAWDRRARDVFSSELKALGEPTMLGARQGESYRVMLEVDAWQLLLTRAEPGSVHEAAVERLPIKSVEERADASSSQEEFGPRGCRTRLLSASDWSSIRDCFEKTSFWTAPTGHPAWHTFHSRSLIIEARQQQRYHFVVRMGGDLSPSPKDEPFMECARLLLKVSSEETRSAPQE